MTPATLVLVRHGETDWNRDRRVQGHTDVPLNDSGRRQARALAATLGAETFGAVYSSDLSRAFETAQILAGALALDVMTSAALREKHFGSWEGLTDVEVNARFPAATAGGWGDGETTEELAARVLPAIHSIGADHGGETVLVVTHGGPIRAVLHDCAVEHGPIANCAVVRLLARDGALRHVD